ncbi:hypothetical protein E2562_009262 [Oryza meyeriana var. granulata]|uniref:Reverse transcriptase Ty1/copia-type domain-containing protein n=1 Tax=Oryza meyeriana var. granulata TaxID=110450 RepID=A0A6G1EA25_9ORYZ|nr:hypothetical protein E2562_009262 [Oryza meyeriana var. granulata]
MEASTDFVVEYPAMELGARRFDADTWVYKVKKNAAGEVIKHKAWLVAKGYVQQPGVDFDEVFAPVARIESVRLLLALAAQEGWPVHHMDVKSAFLNGELIEEVYVRQPPGFTVAGHEDKVLRLDKALYGLRQAPRAWNAKLDETLVALGFSHSASEHAIYARGKGASRLLMGDRFASDGFWCGALCLPLPGLSRRRPMQQQQSMSLSEPGTRASTADTRASVASKRASMERFKYSSSSSGIVFERAGGEEEEQEPSAYFDLPLELLRSSNVDTESLVTAAFLFDSRRGLAPKKIVMPELPELDFSFPAPPELSNPSSLITKDLT